MSLSVAGIRHPSLVIIVITHFTRAECITVAEQYARDIHKHSRFQLH